MCRPPDLVLPQSGTGDRIATGGLVLGPSGGGQQQQQHGWGGSTSGPANSSWLEVGPHAGGLPFQSLPDMTAQRANGALQPESALPGGSKSLVETSSQYASLAHHQKAFLETLRQHQQQRQQQEKESERQSSQQAALHPLTTMQPQLMQQQPPPTQLQQQQQKPQESAHVPKPQPQQQSLACQQVLQQQLQQLQQQRMAQMAALAAQGYPSAIHGLGMRAPKQGTMVAPRSWQMVAQPAAGRIGLEQWAARGGVAAANIAPMVMPPAPVPISPAYVASGIPWPLAATAMGCAGDADGFMFGSGLGEEDDEELDEKKVKRMMSNRASAKRSRQRRQERLEELEVQSAKLRVENAAVQRRLNEAREHIRRSQEHNEALQAQVNALKVQLASMGTEVLLLAPAAGVTTDGNAAAAAAAGDGFDAPSGVACSASNSTNSMGSGGVGVVSSHAVALEPKYDSLAVGDKRKLAMEGLGFGLDVKPMMDYGEDDGGLGLKKAKIANAGAGSVGSPDSPHSHATCVTLSSGKSLGGSEEEPVDANEYASALGVSAVMPAASCLAGGMAGLPMPGILEDELFASLIECFEGNADATAVA